jgi:predicted nuclease of restriction endonuclease-like RecB superfamily
MSEDTKIKGPASYFPSIEKKYGQPIAHWVDIVRAQDGLSHMQIVAHLKDVYGLGHGHANAIVAHTLAEQEKA